MPYLTVEEMKQLVATSPCNFGRMDIPTRSAWNTLTPGQRADYLAERAGFTYIFSASNGLYKIGCTQDPDRRRVEICSRYGVDGKYVRALYSPNMWAIEKLLHEFFADNRVTGEWFRFSPNEINWILSTRPPENSQIIAFTGDEMGNFREWNGL